MDSEEYGKMVRKHPLYLKGREIWDVVQLICLMIPEEDEELKHVKSMMMEDASLLFVKVAGAEGAGLYDLKMEAAAIIRKAAKDLYIQNHTLKMFGFEKVDYYRQVRELIEEYCLLFIEWVNGFDKEDYVIDRWELFNPPGIGPYNKDPDDDIPFEEDDDED